MTDNDKSPLTQFIHEQLERYVEVLDGETPSALHSLVVDEAERAVMQFALDYCDQNQSQAALILGVSRGNLRKKLGL
ncbi:MAG: Fis family transcriptional regulator [Gammaproteobacteria bacterium]|nr:Fis family transcriptional regulator [Gammaproteobacteria bacterium]